MRRSGLVPRAIPAIGLLGGPLVLASSVAVLFGAYAQTSAVAAGAAFAVFAWEMSLAAWMIVRGLGVAARDRRGQPQRARSMSRTLNPSAQRNIATSDSA